ncbi:hypothetical protein D3C85_374690 [compost metagenome]
MVFYVGCLGIAVALLGYARHRASVQETQEVERRGGLIRTYLAKEAARREKDDTQFVPEGNYLKA